MLMVSCVSCGAGLRGAGSGEGEGPALLTQLIKILCTEQSASNNNKRRCRGSSYRSSGGEGHAAAAWAREIGESCTPLIVQVRGTRGMHLFRESLTAGLALRPVLFCRASFREHRGPDSATREFQAMTSLCVPTPGHK
ncbi:unnamed protein product [Pieris macdunnoughi]|uniref:Uncharacterized protein n=1 Tax=Pieris macdunnoughi TaxID=345717 RepID=A0A821VQN9_9NEOP|nr:unnamed protein product [Pieris macdunnoughi]